MSAPDRSGIVYHVDASYFIFRAYHSMPRDLVDPGGRATQAVYGFARFLADLIEQERPERIGVAFDLEAGAEASFRTAIYPAYKAHREPPPPDLARQFELCREFCRCMGITEFASARYEADDLIGTMAARARAAGLRNVLLTKDKDLSQLIRDGDVFWDLPGRMRYHYHDIEARFGAAPERMADLLALAGDAVDNIPGVPGVGLKTASCLVAAFGSLDDLYANLDRVAFLKMRGAAGVAAKLAAHKAGAYLSRRLTGIICDAPLAERPDDLRPRGPDVPALRDFLDAQGFGGGLRRQAERIAQRTDGIYA